MNDIPTRLLVIRTHAPGRRWVVFGLAVLLSLVALYAAFEFGRYRGGFDVMRAASQRAAVQSRVDALLEQQHQLQVQLAAAQEAQVSDVRERSEVARTIGELQAQVERQQRDLEFYRGLVAPQSRAQPDTAVRVQQLHIVASAPAAQRYLLRFTLNRTSQLDRALAGTVVVTLTGSRAGTPGATVGLAALAGGLVELPFNFRYYTNIEQPITLPAAFQPNSVTIEVRPSLKGMAPSRQTFLWEVDPT